MVRLDDSVLMRSKFVELLFEELLFLSRGGFLVQDEDAADIVGMNLAEGLVQLR